MTVAVVGVLWFKNKGGEWLAHHRCSLVFQKCEKQGRVGDSEGEGDLSLLELDLAELHVVY